MPEIDRQSELNTFEVEITDLDTPQQSKHALFRRAERLLLRWQFPERRRTRRWLSRALLLGLALLLLAVLLDPAAGVTTLLAAHWPFQPVKASLARNSSSNRIFFHSSGDILCPVQAAWAPDNSYIAILGYTQSCAQDNYVPARIDLYNAVTARRVASWQPDRAIITALRQLPGISASTKMKLARKIMPGLYSPAPPIAYLQMLWSPNGTHLAISFGAATRAVDYEGLFLTDLGGVHTQVLLQPEPQQFDLNRLPPLQWDLQHNSASPFNVPPFALSYAWDARDRLVPLASLGGSGNSTAYAALPPGNLSGGRAFSIWQPGHSIVLSLMHIPSVYLWYSSFAAWSPDGRSLITNFTVSGLMEPPGQAFPTPSALNAMEVQGVPRVPAHDPALLPTSASAQTVAWNSAGTLLAVYDLSGFVDLYDCHTGLLLRSLKPPSAHPLSGSATLLSWSPDGHSLLLTSSQWGLVTLWNIDRVLYSGKIMK